MEGPFAIPTDYATLARKSIPYIHKHHTTLVHIHRLIASLEPATLFCRVV